MRQAAGRHARGGARAQRAGGVPLRRLDQARHRSGRPESASTWSRRSRSRATPTRRGARAWRSTPAPARAAAAACSPTTPCSRSSPCSAWSRCTWSRRRPTIRAGSREFPEQLVDCLVTMTRKGIRPRDIVTPASLRNALTVAIAMGGSTNVALHSVEIARAAGIDLWQDVISQREFNALSHRVPVLINARPFGLYSMVDIDAKGGLQVIVKELLDAGFLDGGCLTCTGETLAEQVRRLDPPGPDDEVIHAVAQPFKTTGRPAPPARQPRARGRRDPQGRWRGGRHRGRRLHRPGARLQQRARAHRRPRGHARRVRGPRHGRHPLRGSARRARHAGAPRSHLADHGALPPEGDHDRAHDRRPLLRRLRRPRHRPRRAGGLPRRPDRARSRTATRSSST